LLTQMFPLFGALKIGIYFIVWKLKSIEELWIALVHENISMNQVRTNNFRSRSVYYFQQIITVFFTLMLINVTTSCG
jgi:succinate dehydrogenase hydrophobic anchor subunit